MVIPSREDIYKNIDEYNQVLNATLQIVPENELEHSDKGKLKGLICGVKDNIAVKGLKLTNASLILRNYKAVYDATVIKRLKNEGVVFNCKINMDEFAMGVANIYSAYGPVLNPWDTERVPGGSSGGSAVVAAAGMASFTLGSDTGGSVRQPASLCGVYGYKPTYGVLSRYGVTSFASSLDQVGLLSRTPKIMIDIMDVMSGKDEKDSTSIDSPGFFHKDTPVKGKKIGIIKQYLESMKPNVALTFEKTKNYFIENGAEIIELDFPEFDKVIPVYQVISTAEASSNLARFDGIRYSERAEAENVFETYSKSRGKYFGEEVKRRIILGTYVLSRKCFDSFYLKASKIRTIIYNRFNSFFENVDFVLTPASSDIAFKFEEKPDPVSLYFEDLYTIPANLAKLPAIVFPADVHHHMPLGMQLMAPRLKDNELLNFVCTIEKEFYNFEKMVEEVEHE